MTVQRTTNWTDEENAILIREALWGFSNTEIAAHLPGRTPRGVGAHRADLVNIGLLPRAAGGPKPKGHAGLRLFTEVGFDKIRMSISPWQSLPGGVLVRTIEAL